MKDSEFVRYPTAKRVALVSPPLIATGVHKSPLSPDRGLFFYFISVIIASTRALKNVMRKAICKAHGTEQPRHNR